MNKQKFILGLLIWFVGLPISISVSFILRKFFELDGLGMPEIVWFTMHLLLFLSSLVFIFKSMSLTSVLKKVSIFTAFVTLSGIYYITLTWFYVVESGIYSV